MNVNGVVKKKLSPYLIDKSNKSFLLLVSGGIDSQVLLHSLINSVKINKNKLFLLHCNYNESQNSLLAEKLCREMAIYHNIKIFVNKLISIFLLDL